MSIVLNPQLYAALKTRFSDVKIANQGEKYVSTIVTDPYTGAQKELCAAPGEYYCVC